MPADTETAPQQTTSSLPQSRSFLDDPAVMKGFEEALAKDSNLSPTVPPLKDIAPPEKKPDEKPAETTKQPETKPDAKPEEKDDDTPEDIKSEQGKSSWKRLKESKKAIETERDTIRTERDRLNESLKVLRAEYDTYKSTTSKPVPKLEELPEYQALKREFDARDKEAKELSERLRLVEVEQHPQFQAYFKAKTDQQLAIAKAAGGDKAVEILKLPPGAYRDQQLEELSAELTPLKSAQLAGVLIRMEEINAEKANEIAKAKESYEQLQSNNKAQLEKQRGEMTAMFENVTKEVTDKEKGLAVFQEREGDEEWNKGVRERLSLARHAFEGKLKPEDAARAIYWSAAAPQLLVQLKGVMAEKAALEKQVAELRAATPNPGGGGQPDQQQQSTKTGLDAMMEEIGKVLPGNPR